MSHTLRQEVKDRIKRPDTWTWLDELSEKDCLLYATQYTVSRAVIQDRSPEGCDEVGDVIVELWQYYPSREYSAAFREEEVRARIPEYLYPLYPWTPHNAKVFDWYQIAKAMPQDDEAWFEPDWTKVSYGRIRTLYDVFVEMYREDINKPLPKSLDLQLMTEMHQ